jgi:hypothetical protein
MPGSHGGGVVLRSSSTKVARKGVLSPSALSRMLMTWRIPIAAGTDASVLARTANRSTASTPSTSCITADL